jgi:hypothetical protein
MEFDVRRITPILSRDIDLVSYLFSVIYNIYEGKLNFILTYLLTELSPS